VPSDSPCLSIIVPVFNEERTLREIVERIRRHCPDAQIVFVDDGSTDGSLTILHQISSTADTVLTKPNGGKGSAIRHGLPYCRGRTTIIQDADLEYDPADIPALVREAEQRNLPAVFGSRRLRRQERQYAKWRYYIGGNLLSTITNVLFGSHLTDMMTCYKLITTPIFQSLSLSAEGFGIEPDITAHLLRRAVPIAEVPIFYRPRTRTEGKKIGWKDFFRCLGTLVRIRLGR